MSDDRVCVRGCVQRGVHFATCSAWGDPDDVCAGCAPRECRDGSLICDRCFGHMRALILDAPDLLARLRSLADPSKATPTDQVPSGRRSSEPPAPVGADILDALVIVEVAAMWDEPHLRVAANNRAEAIALGELLLQRHPEVDGIREHWSVQDAIDRWGVERRDPNQVVWEPDVDGEIAAWSVHEYGNPLVSQQDAIALTGIKASTFRRWEKRGLFTRAITVPGPRGSRKAMYRLRDVRAVWETEGANA